MRRISIVGISGSGKSTVAAALAQTLELPCLELDAINHQQGWTPLPPEELTSRVDDFTMRDGWIVDGNYSSVREMIWSRADTVIWIDLKRSTVMRQIIWRSIRRVVLREQLWNGNRESVRFLLAWDPERSVIRWAWTRYHVRRDEALAAMTDERWKDLTFIRLESRRAITALMETIASK
jgi:adenylate kinase family enzyme